MACRIGYVIGVLASVYHLANGIWTFGITWGIWTSERAMRGASYVCLVFGIVLGGVGMSALVGMTNVDIDRSRLKSKIAWSNSASWERGDPADEIQERLTKVSELGSSNRLEIRRSDTQLLDTPRRLRTLTTHLREWQNNASWSSAAGWPAWPPR